jgi:hypothetical protein
VKEDGAEKQNFAYPKDGMVVKLHHGIKQVAPPTDEGSVNDVNEQEDENSDACQAMQKPSPHAWVTAISPEHGFNSPPSSTHLSPQIKMHDSNFATTRNGRCFLAMGRLGLNFRLRNRLFNRFKDFINGDQSHASESATAGRTTAAGSARKVVFKDCDAQLRLEPERVIGSEQCHCRRPNR